MSFDATPEPFHGPWQGDTKIVLGIDIGTTQSGVAFSFLQRDESQVVHRVARWPGQEAHNQRGQTPTLVWYDTNQRAVSFGAEAQLPTTTEEQAEDNGWVLAKHFKLHLYPSDMLARHGLTLDPLPHGVSLSRIYSDFLGYLLHHTKTYFEDRILDGKSIWEQYSPAMEVVITHPNGWSLREESFLRLAAVTAGFSTPGQASKRISFVTETEASVHFYIHYSNLGDVLRPGMNFAICEADDSIVKSTLYSVISMRPTVKLREQRATVCTQAGSAFVGLEAEKFLRKSLENIGLPVDRVVDYTRAGVEDFRRITARLFMDETSTYSIAFAPISFNNPAINTRRGRMMVPGSTIKGFFDVCVKQITESVDQQLDFNAARGLDTSYIILAGTFGDSPYLRQEFRKRYEPQGRRIILPNDSTSKAAAEGAVFWKTCGSSDCALQLSWGVETSVTFDYNNPDHQDREKITMNTTWTVTPGKWKCFAIKGTTPDKNSIIRIPFSLDFPSRSDELGPFELKIYNYSGNDEPVWIKNKQGGLLPRFRNAATIQTNLENLREALEPILTLDGSLQWQLDFDACVQFGDTALEAYLEWQDKGITREGPRTSISLFDDA